MKKHTLALVLSSLFVSSVCHGQGALDRLGQKAKDTLNANDSAEGKATDKTDQEVTDGAAKNAKAGAKPAESSQQDEAPATAPSPATTLAYQNYDFVPGESLVFEDNFGDSSDGEFPQRWELVDGQAVANRIHGYPALLLTDGNYARVSPRVRNKSYLGDAYTIEFNIFVTPDQYPLILMFQDAGGTEAYVSFSAVEASFNESVTYKTFSGTYPAVIAGENGEGFEGKWHHIAIAVKNHQLKAYVDQSRVLVVPDMHLVPVSLQIAGVASQDKPLAFTAFKLASGGGMNMLGQKFTEAKIVTHGINFDVDKSSIRPESMGVLNQIRRILSDNPDLKFDIGGHTDSSGGTAHNLTLSQQRADAVKAQLVALGVSPSRLTAKGYGDTKPLGENNSPEGKANNRRVEFTRI